MDSSGIRSISEAPGEELSAFRAQQPSWGDLPRLLGFTPDDLECNRAGRLSRRQLEQLRKEAERQIVAGMALSVPTLLALILLFGTSSPRALVWALALVAIPFLAAFVPAWRMMRDFYGGRVARAGGLVRPERRPAPWKALVGGPPYDYLLVVDGGLARFHIGEPVYRVLAPGRYAIYYLPHSGKVVSMAPAGHSSQTSSRSPM